MTTHTVIQLGNPKLRLVSQPVEKNEFGTKELHDLINDLFSMIDKKGGIGIAAPQIGINKRIFVFGMKSHPVYTNAAPIPYTALINPKIEFLTAQTEENYEGCLSVGTLRGKVSRPTRIYYTGYDAEGRLIENEAEGIHARVIQHEYDHLNGIIFLDKVKNHTSLGFYDDLIASGQIQLKSQPEIIK